VPEAFIQHQGDSGIAQRDYESTELTVQVGDELALGELESDWYWCTNRYGCSGWVPAENIELIES
jgi:hypothetical protein